MKKIFIFSILLGIVGCAMDSNPKIDDMIHKKVSVLDKGVVRTIDIVYSENEAGSIQDKGVIVKFDKPMSETDIASFEQKNGLKLVKKLHAGYYVFENSSKRDMFDLLDSLVKHPQNVLSVRPNVKLNMQPR